MILNKVFVFQLNEGLLILTFTAALALDFGESAEEVCATHVHLGQEVY